jgi:hypothetical protein
MPDDRNPKNQRPYQPGATTDSVRIVEDSIRHAFLTHMGEQQRQFAVIAVRRASVRDTEREMGKRARQQQHTGNHDKPEKEEPVSAQRAGAENSEPKRR